MFNLFSNIIIVDAFINALGFFKSYISFKLNYPIKTNKNEQRDEMFDKIIEKSNVYNLPIIERYFLNYGLCTLINVINYSNLEIINYITVFMLCFPYLHNKIFNTKKIDKYLYRRNLFFRYFFAKLILLYISNLNNGITGIKNYHTFILSRYIKKKLIINTFKTFLFIGFLHLLRDHETTYYYYKAIKLSYFYNKGYLFNVINKEHAVKIINNIIKGKKWGEISNEENSNAFYCLIVENMTNNTSNITFKYIYFILLFFSSIWSILCFINLLKYHFISSIFYMLICVIGLTFEMFSVKIFKKLLISGIISFGLIQIELNEFFITIACFCIIYSKIPFYIIKETYFYVRNYKNIEKVVEFYNRKKEFI